MKGTIAIITVDFNDKTLTSDIMDDFKLSQWVISNAKRLQEQGYKIERIDYYAYKGSLENPTFNYENRRHTIDIK